MFIHEIGTPNPRVRLIKPEVARDAKLSVDWLAGEDGRETLRLMGVADVHNQASTLEKETARVQDFLDNPHSRVWMMALDDKVVGAIWIDLEPTAQMPAPSIHLMVGDPRARGQGVGSAAYQAVLDWLRTAEALYPLVYTRHLTRNQPAAALPAKHGFTALGEPYKDADGLEFQNYFLHQQRIIQHLAGKALIVKDGKVLVLRQAQALGVPAGGKCHPPGGIVEPGESVRDALIREVKEETNFDIDVGELLGIEEWQSEIRGEYCLFCGIYFSCKLAPGSPELRLDDESTEAIWVSLDTIDEFEVLEPSRSLIRRYLQQNQQETPSARTDHQ